MVPFFKPAPANHSSQICRISLPNRLRQHRRHHRRLRLPQKGRPRVHARLQHLHRLLRAVDAVVRGLRGCVHVAEQAEGEDAEDGGGVRGGGGGEEDG